MTVAPERPRMRLWVDPWDPGYGASLEATELGVSSARVVTDVELPGDRWRPLDPDRQVEPPSVTLFVDGVRRIDARVWLDQPADDAAALPALCASYAAGVICCCAGQGAYLLAIDVRRGLFTTAAHAVDIPTTAGTYRVSLTDVRPDTAPIQALSLALQACLGDAEIITAVTARAALNGVRASRGWRPARNRRCVATPRLSTRTRGRPRTCTRSPGSSGSSGGGLVTPCCCTAACAGPRAALGEPKRCAATSPVCLLCGPPDSTGGGTILRPTQHLHRASVPRGYRDAPTSPDALA